MEVCFVYLHYVHTPKVRHLISGGSVVGGVLYRVIHWTGNEEQCL